MYLHWWQGHFHCALELSGHFHCQTVYTGECHSHRWENNTWKQPQIHQITKWAKFPEMSKQLSAHSASFVTSWVHTMPALPHPECTPCQLRHILSAHHASFATSWVHTVPVLPYPECTPGQLCHILGIHSASFAIYRHFHSCKGCTGRQPCCFPQPFLSDMSLMASGLASRPPSSVSLVVRNPISTDSKWLFFFF